MSGSIERARDLIDRFGNNREKLEEEARKLAAQVTRVTWLC